MVQVEQTVRRLCLMSVRVCVRAITLEISDFLPRYLGAGSLETFYNGINSPAGQALTFTVSQNV